MRRVRQHPPPAERVDDQRRAQLAAVGVHGGPSRPVTVAVSNSSSGSSPAPTAARTARGSRTSRTTTAAASGPCDRACARRISSKLWRQESIELERLQPQRGHRAGRGLALAELVAVDHEHPRAASRRAPARPRARRSSRRIRARHSRAPSGCAPSPRFVARTGIWPAMIRLRYASPGANRDGEPPGPRRRRVEWAAARDRRPDRAQLRRHFPADRGGRGRNRPRRPDRQGRGARRHRLQVRGGHPRQRAVDPQGRRSRTRRSTSARRSTRSSSPRRTRTAA